MIRGRLGQNRGKKISGLPARKKQARKKLTVNSLPEPPPLNFFFVSAFFSALRHFSFVFPFFRDFVGLFQLSAIYITHS